MKITPVSISSEPKNGHHLVGGKAVVRPVGGLAEETAIRWFEPKENYRYLREITFEDKSYDGTPKLNHIDGFHKLIAVADFGAYPAPDNVTSRPQFVHWSLSNFCAVYPSCVVCP